MEGFILVAIILIFILIGCYGYYKEDREKEKKYNAIMLKNKEIREKENVEKEAKELAIKEKYGECSRSYNNIGISIQAFDSSRTVLIDGKDFSYDEITECSISDKVTLIPGRSITTYSTKTNGGSMFGRALVGAAIAGPIGAVIGGATAKQETTGQTFTTPDIVKHKYYVKIGISRKGYQDIVFNTNFEDRANDVKKIIDTILSIK